MNISPDLSNRDCERDPINPKLVQLLKTGELFPHITGSDGVFLSGTSQPPILDFVAGHGAMPLGHGPTPVTETVAAVLQGRVPNLVQPLFMDATIVLARRLKSLAPVRIDQVNFASTGSEAIEIALNSARLVTGRLRFISAIGASHGKSVGGLSVTHTCPINQFAALAGTIFVPFGDIDAMAAALDDDSDSVAAVILEPMQGEGGVHTAPDGYFTAVRALCDKHGVILIHDEIMTGSGRTGHLFATEWAGGSPDIIVLGKALGGGVMPISACLLGPKAITDSLDFQQMSTFAGNTFAAVAANAMLDMLVENDGALLQAIRKRSKTISAIHQRLQEKYPTLIKEVRGRGLLHAIEFQHSESVVAGQSGAVIALTHAMRQLPALVCGQLLFAGVRVTPAMNTHNTLRILPAYTTTDAQCESYGAALDSCLAAIASGNTLAATRHMSGGNLAGDDRLTGEEHLVEPVGDIGPDEGRFAFLIHPLEADDIQAFDPNLRKLPRAQREMLADRLGELGTATVLSRVRVRGRDGSTAVGDFILVPRSARQLMAMPEKDASALVQTAVNLAVRRGARIIGLGGYTSIVTRGGSTVDAMGAAITTGNGFTIEASLMAADHASAILGRQQSDMTAAIIGAAGSVGSGLLQMIAARTKRLFLFVNPATPREKSLMRLRRSLATAIKAVLAGELPAQPGSILDRASALARGGSDVTDLASTLLQTPDFFVVSDDCKADLHHAEIVYSATNSTEKLIAPEDLRPQCLVCDLSRPGNISYRCREERDDVLLFDGGVIAFPGLPELGMAIHMPKGVGFACMAETVMLALKKHYLNTSVGVAPSHTEIAMLRRFAAETGFELATLRAFDRPIGRVNWRKLLRVTQTDTGDASNLSRAIAEPDPRSLPESSIVDYYQTMIGRRAAGPGRDDPAIVEFSGQIFTWGDLDHAAGVIAARMLAAGVGEKTRVFLAGAGNFAHIAAVAGLWRIGATPVIFDASLPPEQLKAMQAVAAAKLALCSPALQENLRDILPIELIPDGPVLLAQADTAPRSFTRDSASEAMVIFTSGSTGLPKAVPHSLRDMVNMAENYGRHCIDFSPIDRVIVTSKLNYSYGFSVSMTALYHGATLLLGGPVFDADAILDQIEAQKATLMFSLPTVYNILLKKPQRDLSSLRRCISAGEARSPFIDDRWQQTYGVAMLDGLGATEILSFVFASTLDEKSGGDLGRLVPGQEIEIRNTAGAVVRVGEAGVAWVRSNTLARTYLGNPKAAQLAFQDGWYCTNDIMRLDQNGKFYFLGRATDLTKVGGVWMSPLETQSFLNDHPLVSECAVVLYENPTPLVRPYAFVVAANPAEDSAAVDAQLRQDIAARFSKAQIPHKIFFVDHLPRTANGKLQRFALTHQVQEHLNIV